MAFVSLACIFEPITSNNFLTTQNPNETPEPTATQSLLEALEEAMRGTHIANTLRAMETVEPENTTISNTQTEIPERLTQSALQTQEAESLIYGVKPEKMTCEGEYTTTATNLENTDEICSFIVPFMLEFWNVGALGGLDYEGVTFYWSYVDFNWGDCTVTKMTDTTSTGQFSGGPGGSINVTWASIQLKYGQTAILSYNDEDESVEGTCTIDKPAAFSGWTGP